MSPDVKGVGMEKVGDQNIANIQKAREVRKRHNSGRKGIMEGAGGIARV